MCRVRAQVRKDEEKKNKKVREQVYQMSRDQLQVANGCANGVRGCVWMGIIVSFPSSFPSSILFPALSSLPRHLSASLRRGYQTDRYIPENPNGSRGLIRSRSPP